MSPRVFSSSLPFDLENPEETDRAGPAIVPCIRLTFVSLQPTVMAVLTPPHNFFQNPRPPIASTAAASSGLVSLQPTVMAVLTPPHNFFQNPRPPIASTAAASSGVSSSTSWVLALAPSVLVLEAAAASSG
uniref:Uncharacterized protein n=2 Tax=gambiae species complex TaxID=44542 RepID=A0A8W7P4I4_ANOCL